MDQSFFVFREYYGRSLSMLVKKHDDRWDGRQNMTYEEYSIQGALNSVLRKGSGTAGRRQNIKNKKSEEKVYTDVQAGY
jgi:hypothetical protein